MSKEIKQKMMNGKNKILLFRRLKNQSVEAGKLVFQTEHTFSYERDSDKIFTKDGVILKSGELETEVEIGAIQSVEDPVFKTLRNSIIDNEKLELWEVTVDDDVKTDDGKYPAVYCQGLLTSWEEENPTEDEPEVSGTFMVEGKPQFGVTSLTDAQEKAIQYEFKEVHAVKDDSGNQDGSEIQTSSKKTETTKK